MTCTLCTEKQTQNQLIYHCMHVFSIEIYSRYLISFNLKRNDESRTDVTSPTT